MLLLVLRRLISHCLLFTDTVMGAGQDYGSERREDEEFCIHEHECAAGV